MISLWLPPHCMSYLALAINLTSTSLLHNSPPLPGVLGLLTHGQRGTLVLRVMKGRMKNNTADQGGSCEEIYKGGSPEVVVSILVSRSSISSGLNLFFLYDYIF